MIITYYNQKNKSIDFKDEVKKMKNVYHHIKDVIYFMIKTFDISGKLKKTHCTS